MRFLRRLTKQELGELRELSSLIRHEQFKLVVVEKNTVNVHKGQDWVKAQKGMIQLLENEKSNLVSKCLHSIGYADGANISIDLKTGRTWENEKQIVKEPST